MDPKERTRVLVLFLILTTGVTLGRVCAADLTMWDDNRVLVDNPHVNPPTLAGVLWFWSHPQFEMYIPLTFTVWTVLAMGFGMSPWVFHTANLIVHVLAVVAVFGLLRFLLSRTVEAWRADWGAAAGAMLFAVHPVQVEAVAWGTGLKDVMCGAVAITAVWEYLRVAAGCARPRFHYLAATIFFVLAILSKPAGAATPLLAAVLDLLILQRHPRQVLRSLWPWFVLAAAGAVTTKLAQPVSDFVSPPLWARPFIAGDTLAFYLYKIAFPAWLTIDYGRAPRHIIGQWWFYLTWLAPAVVATAIWLWRPGRRWLGTGGLLLVAGILPVLGLVSFHTEGWSTVCDHYLYLAMAGPALALAWLVSQYPRPRVFACVAALLGIFAVRSTLQAGYWNNSEDLFTHALAVNPNDSRAHNNRGSILLDQAFAAYGLGKPAAGEQFLHQAEKEFRAAVRLEPGAIVSLQNLIQSLRLQGREKDAIQLLSPLMPGAPPLSVRQRQHNSPLYPVLGEMLMNQGRFRDAAAVFDMYVREHPEDRRTRSALEAAEAAKEMTPLTTQSATN